MNTSPVSKTDAEISSLGVQVGEQPQCQNGNKTILCLYEYSDTFAGLYRKLGYITVAIDLLLGKDIFEFNYQEHTNVVGIISHPPCTHFAGSGARHWAEKDKNSPHLIKQAIEMVKIVLKIKDYHKPAFWFIENPVGRIEQFVDLPHRRLSFDPYEYAGWADNPIAECYTKKTILWGRFNLPEKKVYDKIAPESKLHLLPPTPDRAKLRSLTPSGFARAFVAANQP